MIKEFGIQGFVKFGMKAVVFEIWAQDSGPVSVQSS